MSSEKRKNRKLREEIKNMPCTVCGRSPCDPAHIRTFKVTQQDHPKGMIPLCRPHHREQHLMAWGLFLRTYPQVKKKIESMGWEITPKVGGGVHLIHPEIR